MSRIEAIAFAKSHGWKPWGKLKKSKGSFYQCFRKKNDYLWIGNRFVEKSTEPAACDFVANGNSAKELINA